MGKILGWLTSASLTLNVNKTAAMYFTKTNPLRSSSPCIYANQSEIKVVKEFKYLGLVLDSTFTFKKHKKKICRTLQYSLSGFRHIRNALTHDAAKTYLEAMIIPHINYCISCWPQASETAVKPLKSKPSC